MDAVSPTIINLIIFVLAIYVGYHVVWTVTPALHTPLMAVTNAISAIVIVGAMLAAALTETPLGKTMGVLAVALAAVNIFGGFLVTRRMLEMFRQKEKKPAAPTEAAPTSARTSSRCCTWWPPFVSFRRSRACHTPPARFAATCSAWSAWPLPC